ncbi:hypothetical protein FQN60_001586 [Etheostoma spectabile]|uniref:Uncharacterized protein n=1 Tax=Etheostoma spectabile TaxID=54343 RepID=A0A5J5D140_9PERO|nr:hypothetical protein FQN60_001586 [Etheostoma spectabile]
MTARAEDVHSVLSDWMKIGTILHLFDHVACIKGSPSCSAAVWTHLLADLLMRFASFCLDSSYFVLRSFPPTVILKLDICEMRSRQSNEQTSKEPPISAASLHFLPTQTALSPPIARICSAETVSVVPGCFACPDAVFILQLQGRDNTHVTH